MIEAALAFVFGLLIGSFLNVCIYRLPRDLSVVRPRSFCPACEHPIAWYDNVPLGSYVLLRAKCRHCGARIGWRYPLVELLTGVLFFVFVYAMGPTLMAAKFCLLAALLVGMIFSDIEERILPDEFTLGGAAAGIVLAWFIPIERGPVSFFLSLAGYEWSPAAYSLAESVAGVLVPSIFLWFCGFVFEKVRHKEGLGLGDVKMIATVGAFLGLQGALQTLILGSIMGTVIGLAFILVTRKEMGSYQLPFGSFLGMAALILVFLGLRLP